MSDGWRWLVDAGVEPAPDALDQLHRARAAVPDAIVLSARVVLADGTLDPASAPMPELLDKGAAIAAAGEGLLAIRAARPGALLLREDVARSVTAAPTRARALAATAAALAHGRGVLVPASVAVRTVPVRPESARARLRLVAASHWTREERLMQLFALAGGGRRAGRAPR